MLPFFRIDNPMRTTVKTKEQHSKKKQENPKLIIPIQPFGIPSLPLTVQTVCNPPDKYI